jgi:hypothetical protein
MVLSKYGLSVSVSSNSCVQEGRIFGATLRVNSHNRNEVI